LLSERRRGGYNDCGIFFYLILPRGGARGIGVLNKQGGRMKADGFFKHLPMDEYLSEPGLSKSGLSNLAISPAHYKSRLLEPKKFAAADLGTAVHLLLLEPELADKRVCTPPAILLGKNGAMSTNACKDWVKSQPEDSIVLNLDEYNSAFFMRDAVMAHPRYPELLQNGNPEVSAFYTDAAGTRFKIRPDYLTDGPVTDLKTTIDASPDGFGKQAYNLKYYWSAYLTTKVIEALGGGRREYNFFAVEKTAPFASAVYSTPTELLELAEREVEPLISLFKVCTEFGVWHGYSTEINPLEIPAWAKRKLNREE
jgi:hypothetical protein